MALVPGSRVGAYEILSSLGAGGMGEVYRARDTKLKRDVALKILPADVAGDSERLARFQREAEVLASLNHPHIAQIFGIEAHSTGSGQVDALVMELVEGEDLSQRLTRGSIPLGEALPIARQIADALEAAHEQGIIHRDLKPANIKVRADGTVKVLDFGLARTSGATGATGATSATGATITSPAMTMHGMILGTAAYMSPEQARGKPVDRRADIWAYGAVVYEMLSGQRAFAGDDVTQTLARVLEREPDWASIAGMPTPVNSMIRRCLEKDPRRRLRDIGEARVLLETPTADSGAAIAPSAAVPMGRRQPIPPWSLAAAALVAALGLATWLIQQPAPAARIVRASIQLPEGMEVPQGDSVPTSIAVSPDGTTIAFTAVTAGQRPNDAVLYVRRLDQSEPTAVADSAGVRSPVFSPDSRWLAFFSRGDLKKVSLSVSGSAPTTLARNLNNFWGAAWPDDGVILYSNPQTSGEMLYGIPENGGEPTLLMRAGPQDFDLSFPRIFDGHQLLASRWTGGLYGTGQIVALSRLTNTVSKVILDGGSHGHVLPSGHLVFARGNELLAAPFVSPQMEIRGTPTKMLDTVLTDWRYGTPQFDVSPSGVLAFAPRARAVEPWALVAVDRAGKIDTLFEDEYLGAEPAGFASNASHVVYQSLSPNRDLDLFAYEIASGRRIRLTSERGEEFFPALTPDGRAVVFGVWRSTWGIYRVPLIGGREERLPFAAGITNLRAGGFSPDGRWLVVAKDSPYVSDLGVVDLRAKELTVRWQAETRFTELQPRFSPTGRHVAYESDQLGRTDVWVVPFADGSFGEAVPVSKDGGVNPFWSADGRHLYFSSGSRLLVATLDAGNDGARVSAPREVLTAADVKVFAAVTADRFLGVRGRHTPVTRIEIVINWIEELRERVRP